MNADELKQEIELKLNELLDLTTKFVNPNTHGINDYKKEYRDKMFKVILKIRKIQNDLGL